MLFRYWLVACCLIVSANALAETYRIPSGSNVVGEMYIVNAKKGDTLNRIAIRNGVGYNEITRANPKLSRKKLRSGTPVVIPTAYRLPNVTRHGIVINLAEMRLYYFPNASKVVTYPVAVGKRGWATPQGRTSVIAKKRNPTWTPPASIIKEAAKKGKKLKKVYPAGPNNPLGTRALRLGIPGYLIHGTNKPWTIGQRRSHGCIRMRRGDVERLFNLVSVGTPVRIINQRMKPVAFQPVSEPTPRYQSESVSEPIAESAVAPAAEMEVLIGSAMPQRQETVNYSTSSARYFYDNEAGFDSGSSEIYQDSYDRIDYESVNIWEQ